MNLNQLEVVVAGQEPAGQVLRTLFGLIIGRMLQGEQFTLDIVRTDSKSKMYEGGIALVGNDPEGTLRFLGKGLDAEFDPFVIKHGDSYIKLSPDRRQVGDVPAVEVIKDGVAQRRVLGFFLLFHRRGYYTGEFYTGDHAYPMIRVQGGLIDDHGQRRIACGLSLVPAGTNGLPALPEPALELRLALVKTGTPEPAVRYDW